MRQSGTVSTLFYPTNRKCRLCTICGELRIQNTKHICMALSSSPSLSLTPLYRIGIEVPFESSSPLTGHTDAFSYPSTPREMAHCSDTRKFRMRVFRIFADSPQEHKVRFTRRKPMTLNLKLYAAKLRGARGESCLIGGVWSGKY